MQCIRPRFFAPMTVDDRLFILSSLVLPRSVSMLAVLCSLSLGVGALRAAGEVKQSDLSKIQVERGPINLEVWIWSSGFDKVVWLFEGAYPNIKINVGNYGNDTYRKGGQPAKLVPELPMCCRSGGTAPVVLAAPRPSVQTQPYLLLLPSLALIFLIEFYPFLHGSFFSCHKGSLLGTGAFVGLDNYLRMFSSPAFYNSVSFSFIFSFFTVLISYTLGWRGLVSESRLSRARRCRVALLVTWIVPAVVSILNWKWLIADRGGLVNIILSVFGAGPIYF